MSIKALEDKKEYVDLIKSSYKKWYRESGSKELDMMNDDLIMFFIHERGYNVDMQPRTFRKLKSNPEAKADEQNKLKVFEFLKEEVKSYFQNDKPEDFNIWHKNVCNGFMERFNDTVMKDNYEPLKFGKAQKIVNMIFKYLSTCDNAEEFEEYFIDCHMVLDSWILGWYYRLVSPETPKSERLVWSNLSSYEYYDIQDKIKKYFAAKNKNPFVEEWEIWEREKRTYVTVFSREAIEKIIADDEFPENTVVISFCDPDIKRIDKDYKPVDYKGICSEVFYVEIEDIDISGLEDESKTYDEYFPEADELAEFIYRAYKNHTDIICQCEYGQSRSAACAAAIKQHFYSNGIDIFADYKYCPNQMVYHKIFEALEKIKS